MTDGARPPRVLTPNARAALQWFADEGPRVAPRRMSRVVRRRLEAAGYIERILVAPPGLSQFRITLAGLQALGQSKGTTPADTARVLSVKERLLLFCAASGTDWEHAGVTGENVTAMIVKGLIERDAIGEITPTDRGRAVLRAMLHE